MDCSFEEDSEGFETLKVKSHLLPKKLGIGEDEKGIK